MTPETFAQAALALSQFLSMVTAFGCAGALTLTLILPAPTPVTGASITQVRRTLWKLGVLSSGLLVAASVPRLLAQSYSVFGIDEGLTAELVRVVALDTSWGRAWMAQVTVAAFAFASWFVLRINDTLGRAVAIASIIGLFVAWPMTGHAAAHDPTWLARTTVTLHTLAGGVWIGSLGILVLLVLRRPANDTWDTAVADMVNRFSPLALTCSGVIMVSGLTGSIMFLGRLSALWSTPYGRMLSLKLATFGVVLALGAWNWRRVRPTLGTSLGTSTLARSASVEAVAALVLLAITAIFVGMPLPHD